MFKMSPAVAPYLHIAVMYSIQELAILQIQNGMIYHSFSTSEIKM